LSFTIYKICPDGGEGSSATSVEVYLTLSTQNRPGFLPVSDYLAYPRSPQTWLLKDLLPVGGKGLLYSQPKVGKSSAALQLANAVAEGGEWMTFPVCQTGRVMYFQLDNPGTTWSNRVLAFREHGFKLVDEGIYIADATTIPIYPFDILQPKHATYLAEVIRPLQPVLVIIDTLRKMHTGDENSSTVMSNVMSALQWAIFPSALLVISHDKKPSAELDKDIITDHRGSTAVVGEMDAVLRLTKTRLYYTGRNVEADVVRLVKHVIYCNSDSTIIWEPDPQENKTAILSVMNDTSLLSGHAKANALADILRISPSAAYSRLRRIGPKLAKLKKEGEDPPVEAPGTL